MLPIENLPFAIKAPANVPHILELPARLDSAAGLDLANDIRQKIGLGMHNLVLDCSSTTAMTAAGLRAILIGARDVQAHQGKLAVCNMRSDAKRMFDACGLGALISTYSQRDEAVATLAA
jgi:anti-anti-sigma factor